jgi:nucleotide-binding universal stress UspA family protein
MGRVLVALAGREDHDLGAFEQALGLLGADHQYVLFTVEERREGLFPLAATGTPDLPPAVMPDPKTFAEIETRAEARGRNYLQNLVDGLHMTAEIQVESGVAADRICATATEQSVDLIVVGSSDPGIVHRILLGSTSDQVVHHAPCPVLVTRPMADTRTSSPQADRK